MAYEEQQLSYASSTRRANQLAHHLRELGVGPEVVVGLCVERSLEMVVALLGILKAGGAYVPLDPHYPAERLAFMLSDRGAGAADPRESAGEAAGARCRAGAARHPLAGNCTAAGYLRPRTVRAPTTSPMSSTPPVRPGGPRG